MGKITQIVLTLFFWSGSIAPANAQTCIQDDLGHPVCVKQAQRVLALSPHLTEIVHFVGGLNQVVAVDGSSNYPQAVNVLPKMGNPWMLNAESILARKPGLVLAWQSGISMDTVAQLRKAGVPVFVSEPKTIEQVTSTMHRISSLLGTQAASAKKVEDWQSQLKQLGIQNKDSPAVPVFYQVWNQPLMTLGGRHVVSEIIELCGGRNVFADLPSLAAQVSVEGVLQRKPAVMLSSGSPEGHSGFLQQWSTWHGLPAVKNQHVYTIPQDILVRNGPRLLNAAKLVCEHIKRAR